MAPTRVLELRSLMAKSSGLRKQGGCCTVALFFGFGNHGDPAEFVPTELLLEWAATSRRFAAFGRG
eukprot:1220354-Prorocentrum_lima.AAC.1